MSAERPDARALVREDRVAGRLYVDDDIYQAELDSIWFGSWVYVGHESEVPEPGDYLRKRVADQELILSRDTSGRVRLWYNRCPHRGNLLCTFDSGHATRFRCSFHGWTFESDGQLSAVPFPKTYGDTLDQVRARLGLTEVAHVGSYAGFVFCCLREPNVSLDEHLAPARFAFDQLVGLSPSGELALTGGWMRHETQCNWKVAAESFLDHYHPRFVHHSMFRATGATLEEMRASSVAGLGGGHAELGFSQHNVEVGRPFVWLGYVDPARLGDYVPEMKQQYGDEEAMRRFIAGPPHVLVFPNLCLAQMNIIVFHPNGPNACVQETTPVLIKDAPEFNHRSLRQCEGAMGPAGLIIADDAEIGERTQRALATRKPEWLELSRGLGRESTDGATRRSTDETDETTHREFWRHYAEVLCS